MARNSKRLRECRVEKMYKTYLEFKEKGLSDTNDNHREVWLEQEMARIGGWCYNGGVARVEYNQEIFHHAFTNRMGLSHKQAMRFLRKVITLYITEYE